jgi:diguanylate cyclase
MQRMLQMCVLMPTPPLIAVMDIDHFKWANDKYGHAVGDKVLRMVAARLSATCRRGEDFVARYGGDELVAVLPGVTIGGEMGLADRILFAIREIEVPVDGAIVRVSCSLGMARAKPSDTVEEWFQRADNALYRAKRAGRDRGQLAEASPEEPASA